MKTLLIGNFGAHNIGDELILSQALEDYPDALVMTNDPLSSQAFCEKNFQTVAFFPTGFRSFLRIFTDKNYRKSLRALKNNIDQIVFPGGGLFAIKTRAYFLWFMVVLWCRLLCPTAKMIWEHQGLDTQVDVSKKILLKWVFKDAKKISTRDRPGADFLKALLQKNIISESDRVRSWSVPAAKTANKILINALKSCNTEYETLKKTYPEHDFVFLAFDPHDLDAVPDDFSGEIIFPRTISEVKQAFSEFDAAFGERLHFLICAKTFADKQTIQTLRMPYAEKVKNFVEAEL